MITLSEKGIFWFDHSRMKGGIILRLHGISSMSGAGDTVIAIASMVLANEVSRIRLQPLPALPEVCGLRTGRGWFRWMLRH
ncbi:MAG: hypothetical protein IPJ06_20030 [Saprospiraceae bacterium]|nr:hypothetical protein [Saprospiraceae bacterium]